MEILRRRTRKIHKAPRKPKHTKANTILPSQSDANSTYSDANSADSANGPSHDIANIGSNDIPTPAVDEYNGDRQPDVFRCLSCFSFFIPSGMVVISAHWKICIMLIFYYLKHGSL